MQQVAFIEHLICTWHCLKGFPWIIAAKVTTIP